MDTNIRSSTVFNAPSENASCNQVGLKLPRVPTRWRACTGVARPPPHYGLASVPGSLLKTSPVAKSTIYFNLSVTWTQELKFATPKKGPLHTAGSPLSMAPPYFIAPWQNLGSLKMWIYFGKNKSKCDTLPQCLHSLPFLTFHSKTQVALPRVIKLERKWKSVIFITRSFNLAKEFWVSKQVTSPNGRDFPDSLLYAFADSNLTKFWIHLFLDYASHRQIIQHCD